VNWQSLSPAGASGVLKIHVGNTNQFPVDLSSFQSAFRVAGFDLAKGALANAASLDPGVSQEIRSNRHRRSPRTRLRGHRL
jgi:hypothetical protein